MGRLDRCRGRRPRGLDAANRRRSRPHGARAAASSGRVARSHRLPGVPVRRRRPAAPRDHAAALAPPPPCRDARLAGGAVVHEPDRTAASPPPVDLLDGDPTRSSAPPRTSTSARRDQRPRPRPPLTVELERLAAVDRSSCECTTRVRARRSSTRRPTRARASGRSASRSYRRCTRPRRGHRDRGGRSSTTSRPPRPRLARAALSGRVPSRVADRARVAPDRAARLRPATSRHHAR